MEELKKFQSSTFDTIARRRLVEDQDTILELTGKIQELQNEINCMNDSKDFQDAESSRSGNSHVTSRPVSFAPHPIPRGMLSRSIGMPSRREGPSSIWETHGKSGNFFCKSRCVIFSTLSTGIESMEFQYRRAASFVHLGEEWESNTSSRSEMPVRTVSQKFSHSSTNYGADQQRLQITDPHFDKFPTPATFACWKIRLKTEVCTCSQFPTEAMHRIKEVEMADSVDDLMSSSSIRGIQMPNFEVLDARIASALNRIIHNFSLQKKNQFGGNERPRSRTVSFAEDRLLTWSMSTSGSQEPMVPSRIMPTYLQLFFDVTIFRNSIRSGTEFHNQWQRLHLTTSWKDCTN